MIVIAGYSQQKRGVWNRWRKAFEEAAAAGAPPVPAQKIFKPRFPGIRRLQSYESDPGNEFWSTFPSNLSEEINPLFDGEALKKLAGTLKVKDMVRVDRVAGNLANGADIGCRGIYRAATFSKNAASAYEAGWEVTDAIAGWIEDGYAYGPVSEEDVPAGAKVSGIMVRKKPNGAARVILNLSAPKGMSVNDGIAAEEFPAVMSSTEAWLKVLNKIGRGAWITKTDWASAYKQIPVRGEDTDLQWFQWAGKYFKELALIFGAKSSAGIFDEAAKVVLELVCLLAVFPLEQVCQHLDDACAASGDLAAITHFDECFMQVAQQVGVKLAPRDDHDKTFGPCKKGVVFGVEYDTDEWTWALRPDKLARIVATVREAISSEMLEAKQVQSLAGKLINVRPLIPAGKFNIDRIMMMLADSSRGDAVRVTEEGRRQLRYWEVALLACNGRLSIPDPSLKTPPWALELFTDAAGGTLENPGRGCGGVLGRQWFYIPWSARVNAGSWKVAGKKVGRKLSALELVGPLAGLVLFAETCRSRPLRIWVDNAGSVGVWRKGYSSYCGLCTTIVKAISVVAAGLGCHVDILKVSRCSGQGAIMADLISKASFNELRQRSQEWGWEMEAAPATIPRVLMEWVCLPRPDDELGHRILAHLAQEGLEVLGYGRAAYVTPDVK